MNLKKILSGIVSLVMVSTNVASIGVFAEGTPKELIKNGTFDNALKGWGSYIDASSGADATVSVKDGKLDIAIQDVGTLNYGVQAYYNIVPLYKNGQYHLSFDISSDTSRLIECILQENGGSYTAYTWKSIDLVAGETKHMEIDFTMEYNSDLFSKLVFNCGEQKGDGDNSPHNIYLDNVSLTLVDDSQVDYSEFKKDENYIHTNQVGYLPNADKIAVFKGENLEGTTFDVVDANTNEVVYSGTLSNEKVYSKANETLCYGDFSNVKTEGTYYIQTETLGKSYNFNIASNTYDSLLNDTLKMFYLQRCGTEVEDTNVGHSTCHDTLATIYGTTEKIDVSGGWHDAGDYGRYVVAGSKAVADLLLAYDNNPSIFTDSVGIPESGNGIADILDEVRYELDWLLKMQDLSTGGVHHKVTCANFPGYIMPQYETEELIVTPVTTTATADFCAVMSMAYEYYKDIDQDFAELCLERSKLAYTFLEENPNLIYSNPKDITTGDYGDTNDRDERYWATAQLFKATGDSKYLNDFETMASSMVSSGLDWATVGEYGNFAYLSANSELKNPEIVEKISKYVINSANSLVSTSQNDGYGVSVSKFNWGSNMTIANNGMDLYFANSISENSEYASIANEQLNYLLGKNALGTSFVTGYGTVSPEHPHHRPSMKSEHAVYGMLVGGVNQNLEDNFAEALLMDEPPAKCYVDNAESYSTNEVTIYWNSPFINLLSYAMKDNNSTPVEPSSNISKLLRLKKYILDISTDSTDLDINEDGNIDILDLVKLKHDILSDSDIKPNPPSTTEPTPNDEIIDYGTPMDENATSIADFRKGLSSMFIASDGWGNGGFFDCGWFKENAVIDSGRLSLTIDEDKTNQYNYSGAEYRTNDFYHYGYYETSMQAIKNDGVVSSFFIYTGPSDNNPWDEIDIEVLGKDTTKVQFNYFTNGVGNHEYMYDLGFDASKGYHTYGFDWQPDKITWYVDGKEVYSATTNIPSTPGKIMMNVWPGTGVDDWLNHYDGTTPLTANYQWVTYKE